MAAIIFGSLIASGGTIVGAVITSIASHYYNNRKEKSSSKLKISNLTHQERDYNKTKDQLEELINQQSGKKFDLYITNLGSPIKTLKTCNGFDSYQQYLIDIAKEGKCTIHRYHVVNDNESLEHLKEILKKSEGLKDVNVYYHNSGSLGRIGDITINMMVFAERFAAITFENTSKMLFTFHTNKIVEVKAIDQIVQSLNNHLIKVMSFGEINQDLCEGLYDVG